MHPGAVVQNLEFARSDHRPILLDTDFQIIPSNPNSSIKFEAKWLHEKDFIEVVEQAWHNANEATAGSGVLDRLAHMHKALHDWDRHILKQPRKRIRKAQKKLDSAMNGPMTDENEKIAKEMTDLVEMLLQQEEVHWLQRSRANWLTQGDRNTNFFHQFATARRKKNLIKRLKDPNDEWVEGTAMLKPLVFDYFTNLFTSEVQYTDPALLEKIQTKVNDDMNERLTAPFTAEDVKKAAFSIGDFKAPGPDGLHAIFYKKFWSLCGDQITNEILQALNSGVIPEGWNDTTIVMIPKVDNPELVTQYRPISLCNVIYKIISKMLAFRLKKELPEVISPMQSAFVPGRLITDNVLVAYECIHSIKGKRTGNNGACAVKLDMHKAYDRVEWIFLENMMRKLGFSERWITIMMSCVRSVRYQVRFNSEETDMFSPTRGLHQGDPLSPYLFLICA
jgi:hypothetical protein